MNRAQLAKIRIQLQRCCLQLEEAEQEAETFKGLVSVSNVTINSLENLTRDLKLFSPPPVYEPPSELEGKEFKKAAKQHKRPK